MKRWIVLTGAQSGKRILVDITTILQVYEKGIHADPAPKGPEDWGNRQPTEHTQVMTSCGRYQVNEDIDVILDALRG